MIWEWNVKGVDCMNNFFDKVHKSINKMGKAPYNDRETEKALEEMTIKTIKCYEELKKGEKENEKV